MMPSTDASSVSMNLSRWAVIGIIVVVILGAVWTIRSVLLLALASVILVVLLTMPIRLLSRYGISRTPAILISLLGIVVLLVLLTMLALPPLLDQFTTLTTVTVPKGVQELVRQWDSGELRAQYPFLGSIQDFVQQTLQTTSLDSVINEATRQIAGAVGQVGVSVLPLLGGVANTLLSILIILFLSMYFLADPKSHEDGVVKLFPLWYRNRVREILGRIDFTLRGWLTVTLISMLFTGVVTWLGMALLGLQQAAALGVLAGLLSFIPNFGPIVALIPAIAVGFVQAPQSIPLIIIIIYGVSFVQSQVLSPLLVSESINLPPVLVLMGQIVSGAFFGFMGIMLAVPITAIVMVLVQEIYVGDILGDRPQAEKEVVPVAETNRELTADEA
jgi:predicted PurR-regulated permease PerM